MIKCRWIPCQTFQGYSFHKHERVKSIKVNKSFYQNSLLMTLIGSKISVELEMAIPSLVLWCFASCVTPNVRKFPYILTPCLRVSDGTEYSAR